MNKLRYTSSTKSKRKRTYYKRRSTKTTQKAKDQTLKIRGELRRSGRVSSSCSSSDTSCDAVVTNPVISHEKDREVLTTSGTYPLSLVIQIFR